MIWYILVFLGLSFAFFVFNMMRARHRSQETIQRLEQAGSELQRFTAKENELENEIHQLRAKVDDLLHDPITGLIAWPLFAERVAHCIAECERYQLIMGVLYVDINHFNTLNNALGHELGNVFLRDVAARLQLCIRQTDTLSRQDKDVFVIMLGRLAKPETAVIVAQRVLSELSQPFHLNGRDLDMTVNVGVALFPTDGRDAQSLLRCAEQALQLAKQTGQQHFQFYQQGLQQHAVRELAIYTSMSRETVLHELRLYFQPIMDVTAESIFCIDASIRWEHPEVGMLTTQEIFSYAEKQRNLFQITEWMITTAMHQFLSWRAKGFTPKYLGVPISIKVLENNQFVQRLAQLIKEQQFDPALLILQVPDQFYHSSFEILERAFNMLHYLGVKIALDQFGAGSLALRYLKVFSFAYFKLDRALIDDVADNPRTKQLLASVLSLGNNLSIDVIVQGIEHEAQAAALRDIGFSLLEGAMFSAPIIQSEVEAKLS